MRPGATRPRSASKARTERLRTTSNLFSRFELGLECAAEVRAGEEVAMLALEGMLDQLLRSLGVGDPDFQLGDLLLGQVVPGRAPPAGRCEQPADLREGEPRV